MVANSLDLRAVCSWAAFALLLLDRAVQGSEAYEDFGTRFHHTGLIRGGTGKKTSLLSYLLILILEEEEVSHSA